MKDVDRLNIRDADGGAIISVRAVPGSSRDKVVGVLGQSLKIAVSAAPEKGRANAAIANILAKTLNLEAPRATLVSGPASRYKEYQLVGLTARQLRDLLEAI